MLYQSVAMKSEVLKTRIYLFKILKRIEFNLNYDYASKREKCKRKTHLVAHFGVGPAAALIPGIDRR